MYKPCRPKPESARVECGHKTFAHKLCCASKLQVGEYLVYLDTTLQIELDCICLNTNNFNRMGELFPYTTFRTNRPLAAVLLGE